MEREVFIECTPELIRAAVLEDGKLCELFRERTGGKKQTECLYLGRIASIRSSLHAAFVDIGEPLHAFLPLDKQSSYRCGDMVIVQGSAVQSTASKGLRITDTINLAGKWLVLVPGAQGVRVSKKIKDPALRDSLCAVVEPLCPDGCGLIIRTASSDVTEQSLQSEIQALQSRWQEIQIKAAGMMKPGILFEPVSLDLRLLRDIGSSVDAIMTNHPACYDRILRAQKDGWVRSDAQIRLFEEREQLMMDIFASDAQIDKALARRVWLNCGGYLIIDACEALTVIDVNSSKMVLGKDTEETALRVNLEAAREIARQLRLRDIGGIVIVDYIDMTEPSHREQLLTEIRTLAHFDRSQVCVEGITKLGLVEMTRKRSKERLYQALEVNCKTCAGSGRVLSAEETALRALRQLKRKVLAGQRGPFIIRCAGGVAAELTGMYAVPSADVYALSEAKCPWERFDIQQLESGAPIPQGAVALKKVNHEEKNPGN